MRQGAAAHPLPSTQLVNSSLPPFTQGHLREGGSELSSPTGLRHHHKHCFPPTSPDTGQIRANFKIFMVCKSKRHIYKRKSQDC